MFLVFQTLEDSIVFRVCSRVLRSNFEVGLPSTFNGDYGGTRGSEVCDGAGRMPAVRRIKVEQSVSVAGASGTHALH